MLIRSALVITMFAIALPAQAEIFSCTDSEGGRHVADTLMRLPAECRDQASTLDEQRQDPVNYVPATKSDNRGKSRFERAAQEVDREHQRKRQQIANLLQRATTAANLYENAVLQRKDALRHKKSGFRKLVVTADQNMKRSRELKAELKSEAKTLRLSTDDRRKLSEQLDRID